MPLDNATQMDGNGGTLIPRATIEEIVGYRNKALELYSEAWTAIEAADRAIKAANAMARLASGGVDAYPGDDARREIEEFQTAVKLPRREVYERVARRLTDLRVWSWVVQRTDLEKLMDAEAKEKLRQQMRYVPDRVDPHTRELITGDEVERGMPPVTVENIYATLQSFAADAESIFRRGVANAFSKLDRRFRSHDGFKIGSRIILTYAFSSYSGGLQYGEKRDMLLDIERAFAVLDNGQHLGAQYGQGVWALEQDRRGFDPHQSVTETKYFKIRGFKNGNAHLWFTNDELVRKINKILAEYYGEVIGDGNTAEPDIFDPEAAAMRLPAKRFGFFPTPPAAAAEVIEAAMLYRSEEDPPLKILEPSAGTGNLARLCATKGEDARDGWRGNERVHFPARPFWHQVDCVEIQPELARQLEAEGLYRRVTCGDFLRLRPDPDKLYDRVVMNPPFDLERDRDHVMHALDFLKPDGWIIAIMSAGTEFRSTPKAKAFRKLMRQLGGRFKDLPPGSFSEVGTNVNTIIVRVCKSGGGNQYWGQRFSEE
ncbi:MAG: DUF4942 domain-containing protein [Alphaproteobacteria bacterium]